MLRPSPRRRVAYRIEHSAHTTGFGRFFVGIATLLTQRNIRFRKMKLHQTIGLAFLLSISAASAAQAANVFRVFAKDVRAEAPAPGAISPASAQDPYHDQVAFLAQFDGAEGSRVFTDTTGLVGAASSTGTARISATNKLFGTGSLTLDGASTVTFPYSTGINSSSDFTVEFWVRMTASGSALWASPVDGGFNFSKFDGSTGSWMGNATSGVHDLYLQPVGSGVSNSQKLIIARSAQWIDGRWHHVAVSRQSGVLRGFIDGAQPMPSMNAAWAYANRAVTLGSGSNGGLDDLRVTYGVARYTAPFTPPSSAFTY